MTFFFYLGEAGFKLGFSIILQILFEKVDSGQKKTAYFFAIIGGFCWLLSQVFRHNALYQAPIIGARIRAGLITVLYAKLSSLSHYTTKNSETSKVVNMLSNDFNIIEVKNSLFFNALIIPFAFIGITIILILRLGWTGIIGIFVPLLFLPLQNFISKKNGQILQKVNFNKDLRLRICV